MIILIRAIKEYVEDNYPGWDVGQITLFGGKFTCASISHIHYQYRINVNVTTMRISIRRAGMYSDHLMPDKATNESRLFYDISRCMQMVRDNE